MPRDTAHLVALMDGLQREKARLVAARKPAEIALRKAWVAQREREIAGERRLLGMATEEPAEMTADDIADALGDL
jgi:hypothetical protein